MAKKNLSYEEIELRQTTIDVLARTLPNLEEKEARIVRKHIIRLRNDIKDAEKRRRRYGSRKSEQECELFADCGCSKKFERFG